MNVLLQDLTLTFVTLTFGQDLTLTFGFDPHFWVGDPKRGRDSFQEETRARWYRRGQS